MRVALHELAAVDGDTERPGRDDSGAEELDVDGPNESAPTVPPPDSEEDDEE